jgi:hypothetical protein
LGLALLACQPPTQIRLEIEGGCTEVGVVARSQLNDPSDVSTVNTAGDCGESASRDIVLVPDTGSQAVEILVIASLGSASVDECVGHYAAAIDGAACEADGCADCFYARRSTQFEDGESRSVVVTIDEACAGMLECDLTETCAGEDRCISAATRCAEDGVCDLEDEE